MAEAANEQAYWTRSQFWATAVEVLAVIAALGVATLAAFYAKNAVHTNRQEVRAYADISHLPPGIVLASDGSAILKMRVKNHGKTPAKITDVQIRILSIKGDHPKTPPEIPIEDDDTPSRAFLQAGETFTFTSVHSAPRPEDGETRVLGYIDYVDIFNQAHRAVYGRLYVPADTTNNLHFALEPGWNDDFEREDQPSA